MDKILAEMAGMSNPPKCLDCRHFLNEYRIGSVAVSSTPNVVFPPMTCLHPKNAKRTDGSPRMSPDTLRCEDPDMNVAWFELVEKTSEVCGRAGQWFKPKDKSE